MARGSPPAQVLAEAQISEDAFLALIHEVLAGDVRPEWFSAEERDEIHSSASRDLKVILRGEFGEAEGEFTARTANPHTPRRRPSGKRGSPGVPGTTDESLRVREQMCAPQGGCRIGLAGDAFGGPLLPDNDPARTGTKTRRCLEG